MRYISRMLPSTSRAPGLTRLARPASSCRVRVNFFPPGRRSNWVEHSRSIIGANDRRPSSRGWQIGQDRCRRTKHQVQLLELLMPSLPPIIKAVTREVAMNRYYTAIFMASGGAVKRKRFLPPTAPRFESMRTAFHYCDDECPRRKRTAKPTKVTPRMRWSQSSAEFNGTKLATDSLSTTSP